MYLQWQFYFLYFAPYIAAVVSVDATDRNDHTGTINGKEK